jgi:hypothetical protein
MVDIVEASMRARKLALVTLAVLLPCGFVILLLRFVLEAKLGRKGL